MSLTLIGEINMTNNDLIHRILHHKTRALDTKLSCINSGGCGFVAVAMHNSLKALGITTEIVLLDMMYTTRTVEAFIINHGQGAENINDAYHNIFNNLDPYDDVPCDVQNGHVGIKFDGVVYDYRGKYDGEAISDHITPEVMTDCLRNISTWNSTFRNANGGRHHNTVLNTFFSELFNKHLTTGLTI